MPGNCLFLASKHRGLKVRDGYKTAPWARKQIIVLHQGLLSRLDCGIFAGDAIVPLVEEFPKCIPHINLLSPFNPK